jgi:hypothetical protein
VVKREEKSKHRRISGNLSTLAALFFFSLSSLASAADSQTAFTLDQLKCIELNMASRLGKSYAQVGYAHLPEHVSMSFGNKTPEALFRVFEYLWRDGKTDFLSQSKIIEKIADRKPLNQADKDGLKLIRARFKELRFAFIAFDENHEPPKTLNRLTVAMGDLQDELALKPGRVPKKAAKLAKALLEKWKPKSLDRVETEISRFRPTSKARFYSWIGSQLDQLEKLVNSADLDEEHFHQARKIMACQNAVFFELNAIEQAPELEAELNYLSDWTGKVGDLHDEMVARKLRKEKMPAHIAFSPKLRQQAAEYIAAMRAFLKTVSPSPSN